VAAPQEAARDMQALREAMNDAPESGEPESFPPDRIRGCAVIAATGWGCG
jgi:hypothetical protein